MTQSLYTPAQLGWSNHFQGQLSLEEAETHSPVRVTEVHRNIVEVITTDGPTRVPMTTAMAEGHIAVGDWLLLDPEGQTRLLERKSVINRRAAGHEAVSQTIAANIDTLFIITSCNADFNPARLERYLALARQADITPVVVLTKSDLCPDPAEFRARAERALPGVIAETLNATDPATTAAALAPWCKTGQTVALVGSSGVGKTTLTNALTGGDGLTQGMREGDAKGRHTTTARSMHAIPSGGWLIDTPGMRELRLFDVAEGIDEVFQDITDLVGQCRFNNCAHETEPGCAVQAALADGTLDMPRLMRWQKLQREDQHNSETVAQTHARARGLQRKYSQGKERGKTKKGDFG